MSEQNTEQNEFAANNQGRFWSLDHLTNVGHVVSEASSRMPNEIAVASPERKNQPRPLKYKSISFADLDRKSNQIALGMNLLGAKPGTRIALMVPPHRICLSRVWIIQGRYVVILVDPGMGRKNMLRCLSEARPQGVVGIAWLI